MSTGRESRYDSEVVSELERDTTYLHEKMDEVFANDLLREIILGYVIQSSANTTTADICSVRLVQKAWLKTVNELMGVKYNLPFVYLKLTAENSLSESQIVQVAGQKLLDRFVSSMEHSVDNLMFPFWLRIDKEFFCEENHQSFSRFLNSVCAKGLLELQLRVPENGGSMTFLFPNSDTVTFPGLKTLNVSFREAGINASGVNNNGYNFNFVPFLQFLLNKAVVLTKLDLNSMRGGLVPLGIRDLSLPTSLKSLSVNAPLDQEKLELLTHNSLPNLVFLSLCIDETPLLSDDLIFQILDSTKTTLRHLRLMPPLVSVNNYEGLVKHLRFPVMKCLEICDIESLHVELSSQNAPLPALVPKLKELTVVLHLENSLQKWTEFCCFPNATSVDILWEPLGSSQSSSVFKDKDMESVHKAFPNLTRFSFRCNKASGIDREAIQYLFQNLSKLTWLRLAVGKCDLTSTHYWDSLLCGISLEATASQQLWDAAELERNSELPSIRNLSSLHFLRILSSKGTSNSDPVISDLSFNQAFTKMPSLRCIMMTGSFAPSPEMRALLRIRKCGLGANNDMHIWNP